MHSGNQAAQVTIGLGSDLKVHEHPDTPFFKSGDYPETPLLQYRNSESFKLSPVKASPGSGDHDFSACV